MLIALSLLAACSDSESRPIDVAPGTIVEGDYDLTLAPAFGGRRFDAPIEVGAYPGGQLFVADQTGVVTVLQPDGTDAETLLDIRDRIDNEKGEGLLSVALDPDFDANGHLWVYYFTAGESATVLSRFAVRGEAADPDSELRVLHLEQPGYNQNGGAIRFGPDGMLYLSLGDGSASLDPFDNGQDLSTLLGSVVRIDVREATVEAPYVVPPDNPFVDTAGTRGEIWAYGVRNPWRIAFDPETGALWGGDVGVSRWEEVNRYERGGNYGWNLREGYDCLAGGDNCVREGLADPLAAFTHDEGRCSVIGGIVYRGDAVSGLDGKYVFGDFCTGEVYALDADSPGAIERVVGGLEQVTSFGVDGEGRVYVTALDGSVWTLEGR